VINSGSGSGTSRHCRYVPLLLEKQSSKNSLSRFTESKIRSSMDAQRLLKSFLARNNCVASPSACRVEIWRGDLNGPVSRSRSSNRTGGFPASRLSDKGLCSVRPRQISAEAFQSEQAQLLVEVLIPEAIAAMSLDLVLLT
jgi:hypothetical protein